MSRFFYIIMLTTLVACKGPLFSITDLPNVPQRLWGTAANLGKMSGHSAIDRFLRIDHYQATLKEILVENQHHVSDYQLVNANSDNKGLGIGLEGYRYMLDFYVFYLKPKDPSMPIMVKALLMTTGYNAAGHPISLGPAYIGEIGLDRISRTYCIFQANRELKITRDFTLKSMSGAANNLNLRFYANQPLKPTTGLQANWQPVADFRMEKIVQGDENKISGMNKRLVFHVSELFKDPKALEFTYLDTIPLYPVFQPPSP